MKKGIIFASIFLSFSFNIFCQTHVSTQSHQAQVSNIIATSNNADSSFFTSGEDGFVVKWNDSIEGEHYQISDVGIKLMAVSPNGNEIAVYESDGGAVNKVSVWDWKTLTRRFQKKFNDSITSLSFSSKGSYLIIGTATVDGAVFVRTSSWSVVEKIRENTNIVNYIHTSDSEKTVVFYSPSGLLSYYNLSTGQLKQKIKVAQGLTNPVMFNDNIFLAGVKDDYIYIVNAFKGNTVASIAANNPVILSTSKDNVLYYLENDARGNYELKMLENMENNTVSNPRLVKNLKGPRGSSTIKTGTKILGDIILGGTNGALYKTDIESTITTYTMAQATEDTYAKIYGMSPAENDFYFLTSSAVYKSSYDTGKVEKLCVTDGQNHILTYDQKKVILWTSGSRNPVVMVDLVTKEKKVLFTPKNNIQTLRLNVLDETKYITEIESNSIVNVYDFETGVFREVYSGTGVQDAVITKNRNVYIAKSAATNPNVPLLSVNLETLETVPLNIKGNVSYALSTDGTTIYGINLISDNTGRNTYVFSFNTVTKSVSNILKFNDEDSQAFTYLYDGNLYTNIGNNKVYCYNLSSKQRFSYNRSASIPLSICQNGKRVVILNNNGSISWCGATGNHLLADWYLTKDEQWYEF